jgi:hypothetical protein
MTEDEEEFGVLVEALIEAITKQNEAQAEADKVPVYQKEDSRHTPNSMGEYRRAIVAHGEAIRRVSELSRVTYAASRALDEWIPKPVHERISNGILITVPLAEQFAGLGKKTSGDYYLIFGSTREELEENIRNDGPTLSGRGV